MKKNIILLSSNKITYLSQFMLRKRYMNINSYGIFTYPYLIQSYTKLVTSTQNLYNENLKYQIFKMCKYKFHLVGWFYYNINASFSFLKKKKLIKNISRQKNHLFLKHFQIKNNHICHLIQKILCNKYKTYDYNIFPFLVSYFTSCKYKTKNQHFLNNYMTSLPFKMAKKELLIYSHNFYHEHFLQVYTIIQKFHDKYKLLLNFLITYIFIHSFHIKNKIRLKIRIIK